MRPTKSRLEVDDTASAVSDASSCMLIKKRTKRSKAKSATKPNKDMSRNNRERITPAKATPAVPIAHAAVSDDDSEGADNLFQ